MATHCSILTLRIPWIGKPGGLRSIALQSQTRLSDWTELNWCHWWLSCVQLFVTTWPVTSIHGNLQARILEWVASPFRVFFPNPGTEPKSPALQADFLPSEVIRLENSGVQHKRLSSSKSTRKMSSIWWSILPLRLGLVPSHDLPPDGRAPRSLGILVEEH